MKSSGPLPGVGQLVLLKTEEGPAVALKTRKLYSDLEFAGQVVKTYAPDAPIEDGRSYTAILKIRDLEVDPSKIRGRPPGNLDDEALSDSLSADEELELQSLVIEEINDFEQERSLLAFRIGLLILPGYSEGYIFPAASGIRVSQTLVHPFLLRSKRFQDSVGVDVSVMFSKLAGYATAEDATVSTDSFSLLPVTVTGRYGVYLTPTFNLYGYAGLMRTFIISSSGEEPEYSQALTLLDAYSAAVGIGVSVEIGPQWVLQFEAGSSQIGTNIGLKF